MPSTVTSIGSYAFSGCTGLTGATIPAATTTI
ncbi:MAG: cell surface protein, partial [Haloferula sp.]